MKTTTNPNLIKTTETTFQNITKILIDRGISISTMESCTAGLVATMLTNEPGASAIMKGAFVTYCNEAKIKQGVADFVIDCYGVYSFATAEAMAIACANKYNATIGIGVTGVLDRIDPNNPTTDKNVYYAIFYDDNNGHCTVADTVDIPDEITDRFDRKFYVVNAIGEKLYKLLTDNKKVKLYGDTLPYKFDKPIKIDYISDNALKARYKKIKPIVKVNGKTYTMREFTFKELSNQSYIWNKSIDKRDPIKKDSLKVVEDFVCLHEYGYYGLFKPSINEVLSQLPKKSIEEAEFFEIIESPKTRPDVFKYSAVVNGGYHASVVRTYKRK